MSGKGLSHLKNKLSMCDLDSKWVYFQQSGPRKIVGFLLVPVKQPTERGVPENKTTKWELPKPSSWPSGTSEVAEICDHSTGSNLHMGVPFFKLGTLFVLVS